MTAMFYLNSWEKDGKDKNIKKEVEIIKRKKHKLQVGQYCKVELENEIHY